MGEKGCGCRPHLAAQEQIHKRKRCRSVSKKRRDLIDRFLDDLLTSIGILLYLENCDPMRGLLNMPF